MTWKKKTRFTDIDIHTLETIYADGRAMGRLLQDFKDDLAKVKTENLELHTEICTLKFNLKRVTDLYEKALAGEKCPTTARGLPRYLRLPKRKTSGMHTAAH